MYLTVFNRVFLYWNLVVILKRNEKYDVHRNMSWFWYSRFHKKGSLSYLMKKKEKNKKKKKKQSRLA